MPTQALAHLAWGAAVLQYHNAALMGALADEGVRRAAPGAISPMGLTTLLWSAATLKDMSAAGRCGVCVGLGVGGRACGGAWTWCRCGCGFG